MGEGRRERHPSRARAKGNREKILESEANSPDHKSSTQNATGYVFGLTEYKADHEQLGKWDEHGEQFTGGAAVSKEKGRGDCDLGGMKRETSQRRVRESPEPTGKRLGGEIGNQVPKDL